MPSRLITWWLYAKSPPMNSPDADYCTSRLMELGSQMLAYRQRIFGGAVLQPLFEDALSFVFLPSSFPVLRSTKCSWEQAGQNTP
ncbi:hypothetical protein [Bradyrhizobium sp. 25ACV]